MTSAGDPSSARIIATETGWVMYGSPLRRVWPRCACSATVYARRTSSGLSFGLIAVMVSSSGASSGSTAVPAREEKNDSRERLRRGACDGDRGVEASGGALRGPPVGAEAFEGGDAGSCGMDTSWLRGPVYARVTTRQDVVPRRGVGGRTGSVLDLPDRRDLRAGQPVTAPEADELDEERGAEHVDVEASGELQRGRRGPAGGQEVVDHQHTGSRREGVLRDLDPRAAVLEVVGQPGGLSRQLPGLAHGDEAGADLVGQRGAEHEAARLGADDDVDVLGEQGAPVP